MGCTDCGSSGVYDELGPIVRRSAGAQMVARTAADIRRQELSTGVHRSAPSAPSTTFKLRHGPVLPPLPPLPLPRWLDRELAGILGLIQGSKVWAAADDPSIADTAQGRAAQTYDNSGGATDSLVQAAGQAADKLIHRDSSGFRQYLPP